VCDDDGKPIFPNTFGDFRPNPLNIFRFPGSIVRESDRFTVPGMLSTFENKPVQYDQEMKK